MPPNKNTPNGFYMFMLEEQKKIKSQVTQVNHAPSMKDMPSLCKDKWKALSADQKARYDNKAKIQKQKDSGVGGDHRMDNRRQLIAHRRDPIKENAKRRDREVKIIQNSLEGKDVRDITFFVIDFQVMYDDLNEDHHLPQEIGMVAFTLNDGVKKHFHTFIDPGDVPQGNRHLATTHSDNTHKIPLHHGDSNYIQLLTQIESFLTTDDKSEFEFPPVFCLSLHRQLIENSLEFIYSVAGTGEPNRIQKLYCLEDLVLSLMVQSGKAQNGLPVTQIMDMLMQNRWDYTSSIRCFYHEEADVSFCSLSIVRRYCFAIFDTLSATLDFKLTKGHMPEEEEQTFTVRNPIQSFGKLKVSDDRSKRDRPFEPSGSTYYNQRCNNPRNAWTRNCPPTQEWKPPTVEKVEVALSDEEDDEFVDDAPVAPPCTLKELRKPKTPAMCVQQAANVRPLGRGRAGPRPEVPIGPVRPNMIRSAMPRMTANIGRGIPPTGFVAPPPGFAPRHDLMMPNPDLNMSSLGRGISIGRGNGLNR